MADWPIQNFACCSGNYIVSTNTTTTHSKSAWAELIASMPFTGVLSFTWRATDATAHRELFDIGIGAFGSEVAIAENFYVYCRGIDKQYNFILPVIIPRGTRVVVRSQTSKNSWNSTAIAAAIPATFFSQAFSVCHSYGANTASTYGTNVDPGGTANTYGSWVEFCSAAPITYKYIMMTIGGYSCNGLDTATTWNLNIGVTGTPASNIILADYYLSGHNYFDVPAPYGLLQLPISIKKGDAIHLQTKCTTNNSLDRYIDFVLHCFA